MLVIKHIVLVNIEKLNGKKFSGEKKICKTRKTLACAIEWSRVTEKVKASKENLESYVQRQKHMYQTHSLAQ